MKLNGVDLSKWSIQGISMPWVGSMGINNNLFLPDTGYIPVVGVQKVSAQDRTLIVHFISEEDVSDFTAEISKESILDIEDGYEYLLFLSSTPIVSQEGIASFTASYSVKVIKRKPLVSAMISEGTLNVQGNVKTYARIKFTTAEAIEGYTFNDMIINLKVGTLIIDGIDKLVYYEETPDVSAYDDVQMTSFPVLYPGENTITTSNESVEVEIEYYPVFI